MGTDMYLSWSGMTKEEKDNRITGYDIGCGDKGYIRASIGMYNENAVLRALFPDHWEGHGKGDYDEDGKPFDFLNKVNQRKLHQLAIAYLLSKLTETEVHHPELAESEGIVKEIATILDKAFVKEAVHKDSNEELPYVIMWLNSLFQFYRLGCQKQEDGKKPRIYISW